MSFARMRIAGTTAPQEPSAKRGAPSVLVIDSDSRTRDELVDTLHQRHPRWRISVTDGLDPAHVIIAQHQVDAVVLDLEITNIDALARLEIATGPNLIPIVTLTGHPLTAEEMVELSPQVVSVLPRGLFTSQEILLRIEVALEGGTQISSGARRLVRKAMSYIHTRYPEPITRRALARYVGASDDYLTRSFGRETGLSPMRYLNRFRVHKARLLLRSSELPVTQIALKCGYNEAAYFTRMFHRDVGITPSQYRSVRPLESRSREQCAS